MRKRIERNGSAAVVTVRIPAEIRDEIDQHLDARTIPIPRNTWIVEAVVEKLERERVKVERRNGTR